MEEKIITAEGSLCYQIEKGRGTPLIFLHGGGGSLSAWSLIKPYFHTIRKTKIYIDLRGHGKSFRPDNWQEYSLEKHAEDILALISKLKLKKCIVIGHCLGSMVAATFAAKYPERVEKLILINPGVNRGTVLFNRFTHCLYTIIYRCVELLKIRPILPPQNRVNYIKFKKSHDLSLRRLWTDLRYIGLRTAISQSKAFFHWNYERVYRAIKTPTCVIGSINDTIFSRSTTEKVKNSIQRAKLFMINSNHLSVINNPEEVVKKMRLLFR